MPGFDKRKPAALKRGPKRQEMPRDKSERVFERTASKTHYKNLPQRTPMRGGIRL